MLSLFKKLLPNHPIPLRILAGPFHGARVVMNPRQSLRKIFGLYEHELNPWLEEALNRVSRVIDVGANDGYFTLGCMAAFRRLGKTAEIISIESQDQHIAELRESIKAQPKSKVTCQLVQAYAGRELKPGFMTLDSLRCSGENPHDRTNTLVKIDVEGAEMDVIAGSHDWIHPSNYFVIEVHEEKFLAPLKALFARYEHKLVQIDQQPLPVLGRDMRNVTNWWLVSQ